MGIATFNSREKYFDNIGKEITNATCLEQAMKISGLDYEVQKAPVYFMPKVEAVNGKMIPKTTKIPDTYCLYRSDTNLPFGTCKSRYEILQNIEAFNFLDGLIAGGAKFETAGTYGKNGAKSFITVSTDPIKILDDEIQPYILLLNSFDGTGSVKAMFTPIRTWCSNTLNLTFKKVKELNLTCVNVRHTKNIGMAMEQAKTLLLKNTKYLATLEAISQKLAVTPFSKEAFEEMVKVLYPQNDPELGKRKITINTSLAEELLKAYAEQDLGNFDGTAYKAFQAVADFESHKPVKRKTDKANEQALLTVINGMPVLNFALEYLMDKTGVQF